MLEMNDTGEIQHPAELLQIMRRDAKEEDERGLSATAFSEDAPPHAFVPLKEPIKYEKQKSGPNYTIGGRPINRRVRRFLVKIGYLHDNRRTNILRPFELTVVGYEGRYDEWLRLDRQAEFSDIVFSGD